MSQSTALRTAFVVLALVAAGCSGDGAVPTWTAMPVRPETPAPASPDAGASGSPGSPEPSAAASEAAPSAAASPPGDGETVQLTIGTDTGAALQFDPTTATAPAGATIQLTFENRAAGVPHNLTFGEPINQATSTTVQAGASENLEFPAPEPGDYQYVCTLHPGMEGTLTIEAP